MTLTGFNVSLQAGVSKYFTLSLPSLDTEIPTERARFLDVSFLSACLLSYYYEYINDREDRLHFIAKVTSYILGMNLPKYFLRQN
jgi:hypothetical protein